MQAIIFSWVLIASSSLIVLPRPTDPADLAPGKIPGVRAAMERFIEDREIVGAVTLVADDASILHLDAVGLANQETERDLRDNDLFWIASMTKPITATAIMMLQDEGLLSVDDPVAKYLPEFSQLQDQEGFPVTVTIAQLLTHTSGLAEISREQAASSETLADTIPMIVEQPVKFHPGTRWTYCQTGINTAARIVEVISGQPFDSFLDQRLFEPLGMSDTTFYLKNDQLDRLVVPYRKTDQGTLVATENWILYGKSPTSRDRFPAANGGLFSTAEDYVRFAQMILNGGQLDGRRYVSQEAVDQMTSPQTGSLTTGFTPGNGWGLGWCVIREPQGKTAMLSPGTFGHGGAFGTQVWIDPQERRIYLLMVQRSNFPNADASEVRQEFQSTVTQALVP